MDTPDISSGRSPRRELQGPRPAPLKVRKDSHMIRKPPVVPPPAAEPPHRAAQGPPRPPVIIYTVSPKIIHANPNEFMSLVQRLTGPTPNSAPSFSFPEHNGAVSPAARLASIEKAKSPVGQKPVVFGQNTGLLFNDEGWFDDMGLVAGNIYIQRTASFPAILSPNPNALQPIPPDFFPPASLDNGSNNPLSFRHDLTPVLNSNRNYYENNNNNNNFLSPSPSTNFISPCIYTPSPNTLHIFHSLFDL